MLKDLSLRNDPLPTIQKLIKERESFHLNIDKNVF
jgi:hypothetical protein